MHLVLFHKLMEQIFKVVEHQIVHQGQSHKMDVVGEMAMDEGIKVDKVEEVFDLWFVSAHRIVFYVILNI